jgi:hypothetical protein
VEEARARILKAVDEARAREGNPVKPGKRRHIPMKPKPHPKGLARDFGPWVTVCPSCGHDLYTNPRLDDALGDFSALFNASVAGLPERVAA